MTVIEPEGSWNEMDNKDKESFRGYMKRLAKDSDGPETHATRKKTTMSEYQLESRTHAIYHVEDSVIYPALGLAGEAGEVAGKVSKIMRDSDGSLSEELREDLGKELGDVLWFVAQLASDLSLNLGEIARGNLRKLADRSERGVLGGSGDDR